MKKAIENLKYRFNNKSITITEQDKQDLNTIINSYNNFYKKTIQDNDLCIKMLLNTLKLIIQQNENDTNLNVFMLKDDFNRTLREPINIKIDKIHEIFVDMDIKRLIQGREVLNPKRDDTKNWVVDIINKAIEI